MAIGALVMLTACATNRESSTANRERATFELRLVDDHPSAGSKPMTVVRRPESDGTPEVLHVQDTVLLDQTALRSATLETDSLGRPQIAVAMTEEGQKRFADVTRESIGKRLAIVIDGQLYSAPIIRMEIPGGKATISGSFSEQEAMELVERISTSLR